MDLEVVGVFKYFFSLFQNLSFKESNKLKEHEQFWISLSSYEIHTLNKQYRNSNYFDLS
jgi:hypothetical protein